MNASVVCNHLDVRILVQGLRAVWVGGGQDTFYQALAVQLHNAGITRPVGSTGSTSAPNGYDYTPSAASDAVMIPPLCMQDLQNRAFCFILPLGLCCLEAIERARVGRLLTAALGCSFRASFRQPAGRSAWTSYGASSRTSSASGSLQSVQSAICMLLPCASKCASSASRSSSGLLSPLCVPVCA